jgi:septal ring factor EnvC (AmiA/AmiB activator)
LPITPIIAKDDAVKMVLPLAIIAPFAVALAAGAGNAQSDIAEQQRRLIEARAQSAAAAERATRLGNAAAAERNEAAKAAADEQAQAAKVEKAQADIATATARIALVDQLLSRQQASLAEQQGPIARLVAALASLAQRPGVVAMIQPGTLDDLVHVRAVLGSTLPIVQARTAGLKAELERARRLRAGQAESVMALNRSRAVLDRERIGLARIEAEHRLKSVALNRGALTESDRAIGLGERARDLVDQMQISTVASVTSAALAKLPGPLPRPPRNGEVTPSTLPWTTASAPYRLPVTGRLMTGFGEVSDTGVRSRGLTFAVAQGTDVTAPAAGKVAFAGLFRDYQNVVIIDHGGGWTSLISGLGTLRVRAGDRIAQGALIGAAAGGKSDPSVTLELRRKGRPVDLAPLTG